MKILVVDDETLAAESLKLNIGKALNTQNEIVSFTNPEEALRSARESVPDIVFLDIEMPGISGVELAAELKKISGDIMIVFVTAYNEYAMKAWELHVDGYLLKPASVDDIVRVTNDIFSKRKIRSAAVSPVIRARCFGKFEVFYEGKPVKFGRSRAKEVLAYLICAKGAGVTSGELCGILWEDNSDIGRKKTYLRQYVQSLRKSLEKCEAGDVFIHNRDAYSVDVSLIDCDYYRFLRGSREPVDVYRGEFMSQYSWSEMICAELDEMT